MTLGQTGRVHFIGIGGAGMSAIAKVLVEQGAAVSGSDLKRSRAVTLLEAMGADVRIGHQAGAVEGAEVVVVSSAIPEANPELLAARELGLRVVSRGEALASLLEGRRSIVVAGTHGKTTTTSMIVAILREAQLDPTYLVGAGLNDSGTNARSGGGDLAVAESDESDGSFLLLRPAVGVVTNVEADHVDHWGSFQELRDAFATFVRSTQGEGPVVLPANDDELIAVAQEAGKKVIGFGHVGDVRADHVQLGGGGSRFSLRYRDQVVELSMRVPGQHNVSNALAAAGAALAVDVELRTIARGLERFSGVERRYQIRGRAGGVVIVDDYAHHPTEVAATLATARNGDWQRVIAVFQPHRYSRTHAFSDQFGAAFGDADNVIVTDVYGAGEGPVPGVTGKLIADAACAHFPGRPVAYLPHRAELVSYLEATVAPGDLVLTMGAGDVTSLADELLPRLESRT